MGTERSTLSALTGRWKYSVVGGVVAAGFVTLIYLESRASMSLGAVFFAAIVVGYLTKRHYGTSKRSGVKVGLIGAIPSLWMIAQIVVGASGLSGPTWFTAAGTIMAIIFALTGTVLAFALSAGIGEVGARLGGSLTKFDPSFT